MKTSEPMAEFGAPVQDLAAVVGSAGPFLSLYLPVDPAVENAEHRSSVRWRDLRRTVVEEGAPESLCDEVEWLVPDAHQQGVCLAVIATKADGICTSNTQPRRRAPLSSRVGRIFLR